MIDTLQARATTLKWVGKEPAGNKNVALLIPHYNEYNRTNFEARLTYFKNLFEKFGNEIDIILIDDGSTDESLERIRGFLTGNLDSFCAASVFPNANKVGALYLTALAINHEFVILSDFDTDIIGISKLLKNFGSLRNDSTLMGCYFRMLPYEGGGRTFAYQQLEYSLARSIYKFHHKERTIRVMPGAGSCYKRKILLSIFRQHSGLRNGEDRETTLIGLKMGYKVMYMKNVLVLTRPPHSLKALIKQRVRWNLGYLETLHKEWKYYWLNIRKLSFLGIITLIDLFTTSSLVILPLIFLIICVDNVIYLPVIVLLLYLLNIGWCYNLVLTSPHESVEFESRRHYSILVYPLLKMIVDYTSWMGAIIAFVKKQFR